jgi:hypothetical protein
MHDVVGPQSPGLMDVNTRQWRCPRTSLNDQMNLVTFT